MPNYVMTTTVEMKRLPWGAVPGNYRGTVSRRSSGEVVKTLEYPNANIPVPDLDEGQYFVDVVRLDANTGQPIKDYPVTRSEYDVVPPMAEMPVAVALVPA